MAHCERSRRARPRLDLATVLSRFAPPVESLNRTRGRVLRAITSCRTAALGGRLHLCRDCGHEIPVYNSCRNRHCPKCQNLNRARWVEAQMRHLLPVPYFHLVFTVPDSLHPLFLRDPRQTYNLLFEAVVQTVLEVCGRQLGATPGFTAVLHTWNQQLLFHPHIHCIITGGGLSQDGQRWIACKPNFLVSVRQLSAVFRGKLLARLEASLRAGDLHTNRSFGLGILRQTSPKWNVYSKPPMGGPEQVLRYLGRYSHRVAIGNERLVSMQDGHVTFLWRDRPHDNKLRPLRIPGTAFARRFLLHTLPHRYVRIRHCGLLANSVRAARLATARALLHEPAPPAPSRQPTESWKQLYIRLTGKDPTRCPACGSSSFIVVAQLPPHTPQPAARSP